MSDNPHRDTDSGSTPIAQNAEQQLHHPTTPSPSQPPMVRLASPASFTERKRGITWGLGGFALGVAATLLTVGITGAAAERDEAAAADQVARDAEAAIDRSLTDAVDTCGAQDEDGISIGDEGQSLTMDGKGNESDGASIVVIACVLTEIDVLDSVISRIDNTRSLDGRLEGAWENYEASWSYHPDSGMNFVVEIVK